MMNYWNNPYQVPYQPIQNYQNMNRYATLLGKAVDNIESVKVADIPLDGSISYYPLTDGTAIVTKQLQTDGTSKIIVYKPINTQEVKYITENDIQEIRTELEELKKKINTKEE
jgi:uncharacterized membrane protein YcaP (DUF421 family)